jgi:hypothetical protein
MSRGIFINTIEVIAGSTIRVTWVNEGSVALPISSALFDNEETLVHSVAAVASGNGYYYADHPVPNSACWLVNQWIAVINANTYRDRQFVHAVLPEVD